MNKKVCFLMMFMMVPSVIFTAEAEAQAKAARISNLRSEGIEAGLVTYRKILKDRKLIDARHSKILDPKIREKEHDFWSYSIRREGDVRRDLIEAFPCDLCRSDTYELERNVPLYKTGVLQPLFTKVKKVEAQEDCCSIM